MNLALHGLPAPASRIEMARIRRAAALVAAFAAASLAGATARADQFVVVDSTWDHTPDLADSHYRVAPLAGTPTDWKNPVDYASGSAHVRLEVFTKPTDTPTKFQACFEATPTYACVDQSPIYTTVGVVEWDTPFSNFWSPPGESVDWSKGTNKIALVLKDTKNGKPSADNVGATTAALYTPTHVRMTITIVSAGSTYMPPPPPDAGMPIDTDAGADAAPPDTTAATATASGAGGSQSGSDAGADGGAGGTAAGPAKNDSGCSVAAAPASGPGAAWLGLALAAIGAAWLRKRR